MQASRRGGVSTYLEAFILIGIAVGGAGVALGASSAYVSGLQGPSVTIEDPSVRQGTYVAVERLTVFNSGSSVPQSFVLSTTGVGTSATYCYSLFNPASMAPISSTCPPSSRNPSSFTVPYALGSGQGVVVQVTVQGAAFSVGSSVSMTIVTSDGAEQTSGAQVTPA